MIYGVGMLDSGMTWDYAQAVMQNEMVRMIVKAVEGIPINDDLMALDVIESVGPGGEYITHPHTYEHMKQQSQVELFDRNTREAWEAAGANNIVDASYEKALDILHNHTPKPLSDADRTLLNEIFKEAEERHKH
jgi:trimethylamine--corrinoid protein Co-methyltransferase